MKKETIVKTAQKNYRLYADDGTVLGTFAKEHLAKARNAKREYYQKHRKSKR